MTFDEFIKRATFEIPLGSKLVLSKYGHIFVAVSHGFYFNLYNLDGKESVAYEMNLKDYLVIGTKHA